MHAISCIVNSLKTTLFFAYFGQHIPQKNENKKTKRIVLLIRRERLRPIEIPGVCSQCTVTFHFKLSLPKIDEQCRQFSYHAWLLSVIFYHHALQLSVTVICYLPKKNRNHMGVQWILQTILALLMTLQLALQIGSTWESWKKIRIGYSFHRELQLGSGKTHIVSSLRECGRYGDTSQKKLDQVRFAT